MKNILLSACLCLFIFATCKKNNSEPEGNYYGYAKAEINGVPITFNKVRGGLLYNLNDSISLNFEKWDGLIQKEDFGFQKLYKFSTSSQRVFKYNYGAARIEKLSSSYYTLIGGDVICDRYDIYEPDSMLNRITITSLNTQTNEISGTFQATYIIDPTRVKCKPTAPDTLRIRNGEFYTKIF